MTISADTAMSGAYDYGEVARSVLIAMAASYAALDLTGRVTAAKGRARVFWLSGGAIAMGIGIWAMHFKGMLAFHLPVPVAYHWPTVLASLLVAIFASAVALFVASRRKLGRTEALIGSVIMGGAIAGMHYVGVAAMRLPAITRFSPLLVTSSILLAILFSLIALLMAFGLREETEWTFWRTLGGAVVMGVAISAMHYTGMAAASFIPASAPDPSHTVSISPLGNSGVALATLLVLLAAVITSSVDRRVERKRVEEALRRSEKQLRNVIETIPAMAFSIRSDGSTEFVNGRVLEYTGLSADTISGPGWQSTVHPDDLGRHMNKWRASMASGQPFENEVRHRNANREYRWFLIRAVPLRDEHGNILKWYGILTDIEDRKRVEALLTGEKRILEMVAKGDSLAQILDTLCRMVEEQASGVLASILLLDGNRLRHGGAPSLPKPYTDAIDGAVIGPCAGSCGTAAYRREQVIVQDIATDPLWADYREVALSHSLRACWSTPIFSSQGEVTATFAMYYREPRSPGLRDREIIEQITHLAGVAIERKLIQDALWRNEAYLAEAQRLAHSGSWAWNVTTREVLHWSAECFRLYGFDQKKGLPSWEQWVGRVHPDDRYERQQTIDEAIRQKTDYEIDNCIVLPDHTSRYLHTVAHPVFSASGELVEFVGTVVDVTEQKRADKERERLRLLEADLAHMNRVSMMGELTASLAHEIKQPLTAAVSNAEACLQWLAREQPDPVEMREAATEMVKEARRAAEITNRVRSLFKKGEIKRELLDVNEVITDTVSLIREASHRQSISVRTELDSGLPKISADRVQLQQVLMNLVLNGVEAMKATKGELIIRSQRDEEGRALISVTDTGVGLPADKAEQIFAPFVTTKPQGTGMGLAISRSIVESHGGRLWATANSGQGATFHFTVPTELAKAA